MDTLDLLLHPVRLRIVHAMFGEATRTTSQLCEQLADVPKPSVYRHIGLLVNAGVLQVADEQRVYGTMERYYRLRRDQPKIDAATAASMSKQDHQRGFVAAMAVLMAEFNAYLDQDEADPFADAVGYRQGPLWLSDTERTQMNDRMTALIKEYTRNKPTPDRKPHLFSPILFPTKQTGESDSA